MNILVAPDSFKHALSAIRVAENLKKGLLEVSPKHSIDLMPLADGGEGTVESITYATGGDMVKVKVHDPLMRSIESTFGISGDGKSAIIEMAAASGIQLISQHERNPLKTTTYGTGELISAAMDKGCHDILVGIGGSATNDGGMGMAAALGVRFLDEQGRDLTPRGESLGLISQIILDGLDQRIKDTRIEIACDVTNPFTGPEGASQVYGPQKGADPEMVTALDKSMSHFAAMIRKHVGIDLETIPGAGAAGGLGGGLVAFLDAKLVEGFPAIALRVGLETAIQKTDLIITGEGKIDQQTQFGKTPAGVANLAKKYDKPVIAVAGTVGEDVDALYELGIDLILPILNKPMLLAEAIDITDELLVHTGERIARILNLL